MAAALARERHAQLLAASTTRGEQEAAAEVAAGDEGFGLG